MLSFFRRFQTPSKTAASCHASRYLHHFIGFVKVFAQMPLAAATIADASAPWWNGSAPAVQMTRTTHSMTTHAPVFSAHYQASVSQHGVVFRTCSDDELRR
ncbi:hypothetical protein ABBQ32_004036 [Trebouxia sp. C0010 RCD-2024]